MSVIFDQLRISNNGQHFHIDAHIDDASYYSQMYIKQVIICTEDQVSESHPETYGSSNVYKQEFEDTTLREIHLVLSPVEFNESFPKTDFSHNIFFVYVEIAGTLAPDTPCGMDGLVTLGVTLDYKVLYDIAMGFTRELADTCNIPNGFIDFILNKEALFFALNTGHYIPAIKFWKNLLNINLNGAGLLTTKPCRCHG